MYTVCTVCTEECKLCQKCANRYKIKTVIISVHTLLQDVFSRHKLPPYFPPLLTIQAARGPPNQAFPSLTVILQGGKSGLSAGPVFRVMACSEHRAFRAHMEPTFVLTWNPCAHGTHKCTQCAQCAQMENSVHSVHRSMQIVSKVCKSLQY